MWTLYGPSDLFSGLIPWAVHISLSGLYQNWVHSSIKTYFSYYRVTLQFFKWRRDARLRATTWRETCKTKRLFGIHHFNDKEGITDLFCGSLVRLRSGWENLIRTKHQDVMKESRSFLRALGGFRAGTVNVQKVWRSADCSNVGEEFDWWRQEVRKQEHAMIKRAPKQWTIYWAKICCQTWRTEEKRRTGEVMVHRCAPSCNLAALYSN